MRVYFRVAEYRRDAIFKTLGDEVLQALGLIVYLVPGVLQNIVKKQFEQPVVAHQFPRTTFSGCCELNTVVLLIHNQSRPLRSEPLKHSGDRRSANSEPLRKGLCGNA